MFLERLVKSKQRPGGKLRKYMWKIQASYKEKSQSQITTKQAHNVLMTSFDIDAAW